MLLEATDEDGGRLSDREVRDQAMTLMFAGHDTATSTISLHALRARPSSAPLARVVAEQDRVLAGRTPSAAELHGELPELGMRFGQMEVKAVLTRLLQRFHPELKPGRTMTVRQMPTLSPRGGMPMVLRERLGAEKTVVGSLESST